MGGRWMGRVSSNIGSGMRRVGLSSPGSVGRGSTGAGNANSMRNWFSNSRATKAGDAANSTASATADAAAGAATTTVAKRRSMFKNAWANRAKFAKTAAVSGTLAYASYQSLKTYMEQRGEFDEIIGECLGSCLPQHNNTEKPEALPIILSEENYNNDTLNEWYFPVSNEFNGPDCEETEALCKKLRDCTPGDARALCKANSIETFHRCAEDCDAKCKRCIPDPTLLTALTSTARSEVGDVLGELFGDDIFSYIVGFFCVILGIYFLSMFIN